VTVIKLSDSVAWRKPYQDFKDLQDGGLGD